MSITAKISLKEKSQAPFSGEQRRKSQRYSKKRTYLGLLAFVLQDSPNKMLTFCQLMEKLEAFVSGDRKGLENTVRVCLSSSDCFIKVPVNPEFPNAKRNFWRVDESRITPKMLLRHFRGMLDMFPELSSKIKMEAQARENCLTTSTPKSSIIESKRAVKFRGPFSIESLLKRDSHAPPCHSPVAGSVVSGASERVGQTLWCNERTVASKRKTCWENPGLPITEATASFRRDTCGEIHFYADCNDPFQATRGAIIDGYTWEAPRPHKRMHISAAPSYLAFPTAGVSNYARCPTADAYDAQHFRL